MFTTKADLEAAGYVITPQTWHTGMGDGTVYEKVDGDKRDYQYVDTTGMVVPSPASTTTDSIDQTPAEAPAAPQEAPAAPAPKHKGRPRKVKPVTAPEEPNGQTPEEATK